jgi:predicted dehydrogenase
MRVENGSHLNRRINFMSNAVRVGVVGCGAISGAYLGMAKNFPMVEIAACADLDPAKAKEAAAKFNIPKVLSVEQLIADPAIEIVLNLTVPKAHVPISLAALNAGKHTYAEKPLGINRHEGKMVIDLAAKKKLRVGCAPDTFMGAGIQTARKLIDDGAIGRPVAFTAFMQCRGHESWHASPEFYYEVGGGPMFDMGPYYLTALLNLLGPIKRISGMAAIAIPDRTITSQPKHGKKISVETPDHIVGLMEFENGAVGTIHQSFAVLESGHDGKHPIIINGTDGAIHVPDPNGFDGTVKLRKLGEKEAVEVPHLFVKGYGRSVGLADLAVAIRSGRADRANGQQAFCVLDLMQGFLDSSADGKAYVPTALYQRPALMPANLPFGELDQ